MDGGAWWATYSPWGYKELDTTERINFNLKKKKIFFLPFVHLMKIHILPASNFTVF